MDAGGSGADALLGQEEDEEAMNAMAASTANAMALAAREYRRGNWTLPETMLLIEAKKRVHDGRRPAADQGLARWRWVEDYCWRRGCRRSQNQCNDRWDNLMRDYKKVRAHELAAGAGAGGGGPESYWVMDRAERKERGLPANLLREIYDAMGEVVERRLSSGGGGAVFLGASSSGSGLADVPAMAMQASPLAQLLPRPLETTANCSSGSPERKRRRPSLVPPQPPGGITISTPRATGRQGHQEHHEDAEYDHHGADESSDDVGGDKDEDEDEDGLGGAIGRCAAILSVALENREASEERRHREVMAAEERRGRARQARREAGEQCMAGLAAAVRQLAGSMLALAAKRRGPAAPK